MNCALIALPLALMLLAPLPLAGQDPARDKGAIRDLETSARALIAGHERARRDFREALRKAKTDDARSRLVQERPQAAETARAVWQKVRARAAAPELADEILWCFREAPRTPVARAALEALMRHHRETRATRDLPRMLLLRGHPRALEFLDQLSHSKSWEIRGEASLALAKILGEDPSQKTRAKKILRAILSPPTSDPAQARLPKPPVTALQGSEAKRRAALSARARRQLFALEHLIPPAPAPLLRGPALSGGKLDLMDFRGRVVLVEFWGDW